MTVVNQHTDQTTGSSVNRRKVGGRYEQAVGYYLEQQGCEILEYNYRCRAGEIDIVMRDGEYLVFCEVKYRKRKNGGALEAVDRRKQQTIFRCAECYLLRHHIGETLCRFDVIGVEGSRIIWIKDAFNGT